MKTEHEHQPGDKEICQEYGSTMIREWLPQCKRYKGSDGVIRKVYASRLRPATAEEIAQIREAQLQAKGKR
jgi:hypothetical protein